MDSIVLCGKISGSDLLKQLFNLVRKYLYEALNGRALLKFHQAYLDGLVQERHLGFTFLKQKVLLILKFPIDQRAQPVTLWTTGVDPRNFKYCVSQLVVKETSRLIYHLSCAAERGELDG